MEINIWIKCIVLYDKISNGLYLIFFWGGGGVEYCVSIPRILKSSVMQAQGTVLYSVTEELHECTYDWRDEVSSLCSVDPQAGETHFLGHSPRHAPLPPRPLSSHCSIRQTWPSFQGEAFNWVRNKSNSTAQIHVSLNNILKYDRQSEWIFLVYTRYYFINTEMVR